MHSILIGQRRKVSNPIIIIRILFFYSLDSDKKYGVLFYRDSILKQNPLIKTHCGHIGYIYPKHFGGDDDDDPKPDKSGDKDAD